MQALKNKHSEQTEHLPLLSSGKLVLIIALNLVPIYGVLFWNWDSFDLIFLYWFENLIIGAFTWIGFYFLFAPVPAKISISIFFSIHYGLFCFVHGIFIVSLFGEMAGLDTNGDFNVYTFIEIIQQQHLYIAVAGLILLNLFFFSREITEARTEQLRLKTWMSIPYRRILIVHFFILASGFMLSHLNNPVAGLILLVLVKCAFDIFNFRKQQAKLQPHS